MRALLLFRKTALLFEKRSKNFCLIAAALWSACAHAERVVSLNLCTDQLLTQLAPEQIIALEPLARDATLSFFAPQAEKFPTVRADAEAVLALHPTLILAGPYGAQTTIALLRARGLRIIQLPDPATFPEIAAQITSVSKMLNAEARGRALISAMWRRLAAVQKRSGTAILYEAGGWTAGPASFGNAVLHAAGLQNLGTGGRMGTEALLATRPDLLVTDLPPRYPSLATDIGWHPALRRLARAVIPPALLVCHGPYSVSAVEAVSK